MIPDNMKICPHCSLLPPKRFPLVQYSALTLIALFAAFYFRPFMDGPAIKSASTGTLWVAFVVFTVFALIFAFVALVLFRAYRNRSYKGKITNAERDYFVRMKKHIESGHHNFDGKYCTVCGKRK